MVCWSVCVSVPMFSTTRCNQAAIKLCQQAWRYIWLDFKTWEFSSKDLVNYGMKTN